MRISQRSKGRSCHVIFGYLQAREIYKGWEIQQLKVARPALSNHPHVPEASLW